VHPNHQHPWDFKRSDLFTSSPHRREPPVEHDVDTVRFLVRWGLSHVVFGVVFATVVLPVGFVLRRPLKAKLGLGGSDWRNPAWCVHGAEHATDRAGASRRRSRATARFRKP
jgi:hypothetical protein